MQKLRSALQDTSREPRYIETLPKVGYRFKASVELLIPVSDEEPQSAATSDSAELPLIDTISDELLTAPPIQGRHWPYWAAAVLSLALLTAYIGYRHSRNQHVPVAQAQPPFCLVPAELPRRSVAVMGFTNVSGNAQNLWLSTAFTEMLATELAAGDHLRTVAEEHVARAKLELSLTNRDSYADDTLAKIHKDLGCDYVVAGSYLAIGPAGNGRASPRCPRPGRTYGGYGCECCGRRLPVGPLRYGVSGGRTTAGKTGGRNADLNRGGRGQASPALESRGSPALL